MKVNLFSFLYKRLVIEKDNEWKTSLYKEINDLNLKYISIENDLTTKSTQFEKLKEDFLYNFKVIKQRDEYIKKLDEQILSLNKVCFKYF